MNKNIRHRQIREILDNDLNINRQLLRIQIKSVPKDDMPIQPLTQTNNNELQRFNLSVSSLRQILEYKANVTRAKIDERNIIILCSTEEVLSMYNFIVNSLKNWVTHNKQYY